MPVYSLQQQTKNKFLPIKKLPKIGMLYLDHVMRFFDKSNFKSWPDKIESVVYHWGNDNKRFITDVRQKKIDVLIGNIPATAYESFREINRALPHVKFIPSLDSQFSNKSKENVTHFCKKYNLPTPNTSVFYDHEKARTFLSKAKYPMIIKKSYGPSNYGGYFVHKVNNSNEAFALINQKRYYPIYVQDFIPMEADIRVMLIGHKPVCAFWRRPPEGTWLTNTSQGGYIDYQNIPLDALALATRASKVANAEYWSCDIAVGKDGQYRILECATAFAAFPYIRDWIGQYLMWKLSTGKLQRPNIPLYNWEELGKINSSLLRTMRHISFSNQANSRDCSELFNGFNHANRPVQDTITMNTEEWPSEIWNFQDNHTQGNRKLHKSYEYQAYYPDNKGARGEEDSSSPRQISPGQKLSEDRLISFFTEVKGIGKRLATTIVNTHGVTGVINILTNHPQKLCEIKNLKEKKLTHILESWKSQNDICSFMKNT